MQRQKHVENRSFTKNNLWLRKLWLFNCFDAKFFSDHFLFCMFSNLHPYKLFIDFIVKFSLITLTPTLELYVNNKNLHWLETKLQSATIGLESAIFSLLPRCSDSSLINTFEANATALS